jgi:hypothetical protein
LARYIENALGDGITSSVKGYRNLSRFLLHAFLLRMFDNLSIGTI